jgi:hypothetical protein
MALRSVVSITQALRLGLMEQRFTASVESDIEKTALLSPMPMATKFGTGTVFVIEKMGLPCSVLTEDQCGSLMG